MESIFGDFQLFEFCLSHSARYMAPFLDDDGGQSSSPHLAKIWTTQLIAAATEAVEVTSGQALWSDGKPGAAHAQGR